MSKCIFSAISFMKINREQLNHSFTKSGVPFFFLQKTFEPKPSTHMQEHRWKKLSLHGYAHPLFILFLYMPTLFSLLSYSQCSFSINRVKLVDMYNRFTWFWKLIVISKSLSTEKQCILTPVPAATIHNLTAYICSFKHYIIQYNWATL